MSVDSASAPSAKVEFKDVTLEKEMEKFRWDLFKLMNFFEKRKWSPERSKVLCMAYVDSFLRDKEGQENKEVASGTGNTDLAPVQSA